MRTFSSLDCIYFILFHSALSSHTFRRSLGRDGRSENTRNGESRGLDWEIGHSPTCLHVAAERELSSQSLRE